MNPTLRFKQDDGSNYPDWEEKKLGDVATFINGRAYKQEELLNEGKYKVLRVGNFYTNQTWYFSNLELDKKFYANKGDLLYTWSASFGPHIWNGDKVIYHYHIWKIETGKNLDKNFAVSLLDYDKDRITFDKNGSTMVHITKKGMEEKSVTIPSLPEQQKIASFLSAVDEKITLTDRRLELMKQYKQGVMQQIFSQEIRFKDDDGNDYPDWERRNIEDICHIETGKSNTQDKVSDGLYPFYVRSPVIERSNRYLYDCEAVLTVGDGVGTGKVYHYVNGKFDCHQRVYVMNDFKKVTGKFFYYFFSSFFEARVHSMTAKTSVDSVRKEMIAKMIINLPSLPEQKKIASFLSSIDDKITLIDKQLESLKQYKKALLQQMFV